MYLWIQETAHSCALKLVPHKGWRNNYGLTDLVDYVTDKLIARYVNGRLKGKPYFKEYPVAMVWNCVRAYAANGVGTLNKREMPYDIDEVLKYYQDDY